MRGIGRDAEGAEIRSAPKPREADSQKVSAGTTRGKGLLLGNIFTAANAREKRNESADWRGGHPCRLMARIPMKKSPVLFPLYLACAAAAHAASVQMLEPGDYHVFQRTTRDAGTIRIRATVADMPAADVQWEARLSTPQEPWRSISARVEQGTLTAAIAAPAGGWYRLEVRAQQGANTVAQTAVEHVGVGEVFVVAGQSNSANHGETKQETRTARVAALGARGWQLCKDPQPGASGGGGSFLPPLGDELVEKFNVPVGFVACGIGATSVREWMPEGFTFPNPPTILSRVVQREDGTWASRGAAFQNFVTRLRQPGDGAFRAVLWHQGESDANQANPARTLPGTLYREYLRTLIEETRRSIGWKAPWFVAQVSYHVPGDEGSEDIRGAQAALWKEGVALEGPDSDALKGEMRERGGKGVHFSGSGLVEHAHKWAEKITPWLERELAMPAR